MLILLSPAKTLDDTTPTRVKKTTLPEFTEHTDTLVAQLKKYKKGRLGKLMNLSDKLAELNVERYQNFEVDYTEENSRPAIQMFRGDVYIGLDADTMKSADLTFAQKHVRMLSGLYGLLKPLDRIQPYRLEMGTALKAGRKKNLYEFWGDTITQQINKELASKPNGFVVNLASNEYFNSVQPDALTKPLISPVFLDEKNGEYKLISFFAKKARGAMARYLVDERATDAKVVEGFDRQGYRFSKKLSTAERPVFRRSTKAFENYG
ncbi:MAG: peroxide stress protein YaaA [Granulosicoccus sp.]|nr:peroxide stress protein YaaA [Granulosicoccus sp.]